MREDFLKGDLFFINKETGETDKIGKISEVEAPKIAPGGIVKDEKITRIGKIKDTFPPIIVPKTITRKRAKKLLMAWGYQRNEAYKIDKLYMQTNKRRSELEIYLFCMMQKGGFESIEIIEKRGV